jgi:hypothetical protein
MPVVLINIKEPTMALIIYKNIVLVPFVVAVATKILMMLGGF